MRIKTKMLGAKVTQEQVAEVLGIERTVFSRTLRGLRNMPQGFEEKVNRAIELVAKADQAAEDARKQVLHSVDEHSDSMANVP